MIGTVVTIVDIEYECDNDSDYEDLDDDCFVVVIIVVLLCCLVMFDHQNSPDFYHWELMLMTYLLQ